MEPRILLLGDSEEYYSLSPLHNNRSHFSFVEYTGSFKAGEVIDFLRNNSSEFDAVAIVYHPLYEYLEALVKKVYKGPKISLLGAATQGFDLTFPFPILPSKFNKDIDQYFGKL